MSEDTQEKLFSDMDDRIKKLERQLNHCASMLETYAQHEPNERLKSMLLETVEKSKALAAWKASDAEKPGGTNV